MEKMEFVAVKPIGHPTFVIPVFNILELNAPSEGKPGLVFTRNSTAAQPQAIAVPIAQAEYERLFKRLVGDKDLDCPKYKDNPEDIAMLQQAAGQKEEQEEVKEATVVEEPEIKQFPGSAK